LYAMVSKSEPLPFFPALKNSVNRALVPAAHLARQFQFK